MDADRALALKLQEEFDIEFALSRKKKSFLDIPDEPSKKISLIDPSLEYTDPTPDLYKMFVNFDKRFFWSSLGSVQVVWSPRMTSAAGFCTYRCQDGATTISLSLPLLKLRPRKDLVETLLHEMIHAYLFITNDDRDRNAHGPVFLSHMHRINMSAGTNITVHHNFHAEVNLYKRHWWRCNGPCQNLKPFYGTVRRAMNRPPGPNDFWFADHQRNCGGVFIKIREPENFKSRKNIQNVQKGKHVNTTSSNIKTMKDFFQTNTPGSSGNKSNEHENKSNEQKKNGAASGSKAGGTAKTTGFHTKPNGGLKTNYGSSTVLQKPSTNAVKGPVTSNVTKPNASATMAKPGTSEIRKDGTSSLINGRPSARGVMTLPDLNNRDSNGTQQTSSSKQSIPFSGKGYSMGKTAVPAADKPWLKRLNNFGASTSTAGSSRDSNNIPSSSGPSTSKDMKKQKLEDSSGQSQGKIQKENNKAECSVACPVCRKSMNGSEINEHLDACLNGTFDDCIEVESSNIRCVACNQPLGEAIGAPTLCIVCQQGACGNDFDAKPQVDDPIIKCPLCGASMNSSDIERHLEICIENAYDDDVIVLN